jgi:Uncharacterised protein family (UPF0014)
MILGNCMTDVGLGLNALTTGLVNRRVGVEAQLMLGASRQAAIAPVTRGALGSALMPVINWRRLFARQGALAKRPPDKIRAIASLSRTCAAKVRVARGAYGEGAPGRLGARWA